MIHHSLKHHALLVPQEQMANVVPETLVRWQRTEMGGKKYIVVPDDLYHCRILAAAGLYHVPGPIRWDYDWPCRFDHPLDHQIETADFLVNNPRSYCFDDIGCVSADTEYLSPTGWRRMDEYDGGAVAQFHLDGHAEFIQPTEYVVKPCDEMIRFKTKYGLDQLLSPEHRVLYKGSTAKWAVRPAEEIEQRHRDAKTGFSGKIPNTFKMRLLTCLSIEDYALRVMVAVIADGYFPNKVPTCVIRLKKLRKKERLRRLLKAAKIEYKEVNCSPEGVSRFSFTAPWRTKVFGAEFWSCSQDQLKIITEECAYWDGSIRKAGAVTFHSCSKESADFIQYAFAATGRTARLTQVRREGRESTDYTIYARQNSTLLTLKGVHPNSTKSHTVWREPSPDGKKYCFIVPTSFLVFRRNGCVFVSGNTGKTLATLWAANYLQNINVIGKILVVTPLSTMHSVWSKELFMSFPKKSVGIVYGNRDRRERVLAQDHDFYIINHDGIKMFVKTDDDDKIVYNHFAERQDITHVILDESAEFRNASTARFQAINAICGVKSGRGVWAVTGSPMPNKPTDAWAQGRLVSPHKIDRYFGQFRDKVMVKVTEHKWVNRKGWEAYCYSVLQPSIRHERDKCVDIPPCTTSDRKVEMSSEQSAAYSAMKSKLVVELKAGTIVALNEGSKLNKLVQIACGAVYDGDQFSHYLDARPKEKALLEALEHAGGKAIIFVPHRHTVPRVKAFLTKKGHKSVETIQKEDGKSNISGKKRAEMFRRFQERELDIILTHPKAMAHGIDLTTAHVVIWWGALDDFGVYDQANGRITRPGQKKAQTIIRLSCSEAEDKIYARSDKKESMQGLLLELLTST